MKIGDKYKIHCYKHNGEAYQASEETIILDIKDDYIVCGNYMVDVKEPEGHTYKTKELAIIYFYKHNWFNCIAQLKSFGLFYYCNMASPYIIDENVIKYIDYDLDLRVFPDGGYKILDYNEYKYGVRMVATSNSASSFGGKVGSGLGTSIIGWFLAAVGYDAALTAAPAATKMAIYGFTIVTPLVIFVIMFILVSKFDLEKTLPAMKEEIAKGNSQTL